MAYTNSPLVAYTKLSPNHSGQRTHSIDRITPHCVVGQCSVETLGSIFAPAERQASSNYGIGVDGRVGMYVEEKNRSWCSSSRENDQRAITIECASDTTEPYAFKDVVYQTLIKLCADICKRNGKSKLLWLGDKDKTLAYTPKSDEMVLTVHRWFANKSCPGSWMYARMGDLASKVTAQLGGTAAETPAVTDTEKTIWDFLNGKIANAYGAAGMMGNLYAESALRPNNLQNTYEKKLGMTDAEYTAAVDSGSYTNFVKDSAGYGLAQWTYWSRKQALLEFVRNAGKSVGDLQAQLDFLWQELQGYKTVLNTLKTAKDVRTASDSVLTGYERPADQGEAVQVKRAGYGQGYYDKYAGTKPVAPEEKKCTAETVIAVAAAEVGYKEKASNASLDDKTANAGSANYTKYARDFDQKYPNWYNGKKNGYAWCDMFVDWCFLTAFGYEKALKLLCQPEKSCGAGCTYSLRYYKAKGQFHTSGPKPGDQIFFGTSLDDASHTGIVEKADGSKVYTIEGNTSDQVARRSYALTNSRILGYGRPAYDGTSVTPAEPEKPAADVPFLVRVSISDLNIRKGPGTDYARTQYIPRGVYTIVAVSSGKGSTAGWGKLKSGAGWISLDYVTRL